MERMMSTLLPKITVDGDDEDVEDEDVTRRAVERVIRKNANKDEFYLEDAILILHRVLPEHYPLMEDFLGEDPLG